MAIKVKESKKNIVGNPDPIPYYEVVDYLNQKAGTNYRASSKDNQRLIHSRWQEGFRVPEFKKVIDNKVLEWLDDPTMSKYLRPETLFGVKFEGYLNQTIQEKTNNHIHESLGW